MINLKSLLEQGLDTSLITQKCQPYFNCLNKTYGKMYQFKYVGKNDNKLYFESELNPDFGDLNLIISDAFMEARVHLNEDKCNFEIYYTLTGLEDFSASVGKVIKDNGSYKFIVFDDALFTDDDLDEEEEEGEEEED